MSTYPSSLDSFTNPSGSDKLSTGSGGLSHSQQHGAAFDAIEAIEGTLGTNPQGGSATVAARLTAIEGRHRLFVQSSAPVAAGPFLWIDTSKPAITIWIEDGL